MFHANFSPKAIQKHYYRGYDRPVERPWSTCHWLEIGECRRVKSSISRRSRGEVSWEFHSLLHNNLVVSNGTQERVADGLCHRNTDASVIRVTSSYRLLAKCFYFYAYFQGKNASVNASPKDSLWLFEPGSQNCLWIVATQLIHWANLSSYKVVSSFY